MSLRVMDTKRMDRRRFFGRRAHRRETNVRAVGLPSSILPALLLLSLSFLSFSTAAVKHLPAESDTGSGIGRAKALCQAGMDRLRQGEPAQAYDSFAAAQKIYEDLGDVAMSAKLLSDMGQLQSNLSQYPLAMEHLLRALQLTEALGDSQSRMVVLNRLAIVHLELDELDKALQRFNQSLALAEEGGDSAKAAAIFGNIGIVHARKGNHELAINFYTKSLETGDSTQNPKKVAIYHNNIGVEYGRQGDNDLALEHYLKSLTILEEVGDEQLLAEGYNNAGEAYMLVGRLQEAEKSMLKALELAESSGEKVTEQDCCFNLASLYELRSDFAKALSFHQRYSRLREEIFSERNAEQIAQLQARFETQKKEDEIDHLKHEAELQSLQLEKYLQTRYLLILCVTLMAVILAILGIGYRRRTATQSLLHEKNVQLDHLAGELSRTDQLRRELVSNVSHDLRSPLAVVTGHLETLLMKNEEFTRQQRKEHLQIALEAVGRMLRLVSDLFELSLLEGNREGVEREPFHLNELVQDSALQYRLLAKKKGVDLSLDIDTTAPLVEADVALIERVLQNLFSNAVEYTPRGGAIEVRVATDADGVGVIVTNSGPGIPDEDIPRMFDRYYPSKAGNGKTKSTGLGLAIVKRILDLHDIDINVARAAGDLVSFCFRVPFAASATPQPPRAGVDRRGTRSYEMVRSIRPRAGRVRHG